MAVLQLVNVSKAFGPVRALSDVSLNLHAGQVIGVIGDLGAGTTTLIKIVAGDVAHGSGMLVVDGEQVRFSDPAQARERGIAVVPQDPGLCGSLSAAANLFLGRELRHWLGPLSMLDRRAMNARARQLLADIRPSARGRDLSGGQRRALAIARTRLAQAKVVLLDEPNATAGAQEAAQTLDMIRRLRDSGMGVLLVSHRMDDLFAACDRIMVLRRGRKLAEFAVPDTRPEDLAHWLVAGEAAA